MNYVDYRALLREFDLENLDDYEEILSSASNFLSQDITQGQFECADALLSWLIVGKAKDNRFDSALKTLVSNGVIHNLHYLAILHKNSELSGSSLIAINTYQKLADVIPQHLNSNGGYSYIKEFYRDPSANEKLIKDYIEQLELLQQMPVLIRVFKSDPEAAAFLQAIYKNLPNKEIFYDAFEPLTFSSDAGNFIFKILNNLTSERIQIVKYWIENRDLLNFLLDREFSTSDSWIYYAVIQNWELATPTFIEKAKVFLSQMSAEFWFKALKNNTWTLWFARALDENRAAPKYGREALNALKDFVEDLISVPSERLEAEHLSCLILNLKNAEQKEFQAHLVQQLLMSTTIPTESFWKLLRQFIHQAFDSILNKSEAFRSLVEKAVNSKNIEYMELVIDISKLMSQKDINPSHPDWRPIRASTGKLKKVSGQTKSLANKIKEIIKVSKKKTKS